MFNNDELAAYYDKYDGYSNYAEDHIRPLVDNLERYFEKEELRILKEDDTSILDFEELLEDRARPYIEAWIKRLPELHEAYIKKQEVRKLANLNARNNPVR